MWALGWGAPSSVIGIRSADFMPSPLAFFHPFPLSTTAQCVRCVPFPPRPPSGFVVIVVFGVATHFLWSLCFHTVCLIRGERESEWGVRLRHIKLDFLFVQQVVTLARFCDFFFWRFFLLCRELRWGLRAESSRKRENCWTICHALNMPLKLILKIIDKLMAWQWNETHF